MKNFRFSLFAAFIALHIVNVGASAAAERLGLGEFSGRWVNLQNQYEKGTTCQTSDPTIGLVLTIQADETPEASLLQIVDDDRIEFVFPLLNEPKATNGQDHVPIDPRAFFVELADGMRADGSMELPASMSEQSPVNALKLSLADGQVGTNLPALGLSQGMEIPMVKVEAMDMRLRPPERTILTADQFVRCRVPENQLPH